MYPVTRPGPATLELERFLTYRIAELASAVEAAMSGVFAQRFSLTLPEWRVLAVLVRRPGSSSTEVARLARLDKVTVSRAVASLARRQRLERTCEPSDRRRSNLHLTAHGRALHDEIVTWSLAYEHALLRGMTARNREKLDALLDALLDRARGVRAHRILAQRPQEE
jgi:DNA-binding MarR family transcriptional regulator